MPSLICIDPGQRHIESQIRVDAVTAYIAKKSALKSAYKRARSVGLMLLVVGGTNEKARICSRSAGRSSHAALLDGIWIMRKE